MFPHNVQLILCLCLILPQTGHNWYCPPPRSLQSPEYAACLIFCPFGRLEPGRLDLSSDRGEIRPKAGVLILFDYFDGRLDLSIGPAACDLAVIG